MTLKATPKIRTSVEISPEFYDLARKNGIKFSEAMRTGISILLSEKGVKEYDNRLNLVRKFRELQIKASQYAQKVADLENSPKV